VKKLCRRKKIFIDEFLKKDDKTILEDINKFGNTETDKIILDLTSGKATMKVVRISPGEGADSEGKGVGTGVDSEAKGAKQAKEFLDILLAFMHKLELRPFLVLGDFGTQTPRNMLVQKANRDYWIAMQNVDCKECLGSGTS
jgi:hypothetical protein